MPKNDEQLAKEVEQIFMKTIIWGNRSGKTLLAGLVVGMGVGVLTWFCAKPIDRDEIHMGLALGFAGSVFFIICMALRIFDPKPSATCPKCKCDWNLESQNDSQAWLNWKCCPGCGLKLAADDSSSSTG